MDIILLLTGLLVGAVAAWMIQSYRLGSQQAVTEERSVLLEKSRAQAEASLADERNQVLELNRQLAAAQEQVKQHTAAMEETQRRLKTDFENLANRIFEEKTNTLATQNQTKLGSLLTPLQQQITEFRQRIDTIYTQDSTDRATLKAQIESLTLLNQQVTREAGNLALALKGESKTQGNWGELILETILDRSGLVKGEEYDTQVSLTGEDGRRYQPDVLIHLPDNKHLIIDSKVSLTAYERYCSADDPAQKSAALAAHIDSIRNHIDELSRKDYPSLYKIETPDFVLMFLPIEPAFSVALQNAPDLSTEAFGKKIILVTSSTLLATLRTVAHVWKQEKQTRNAIEIARQGGALYDQFVRFHESLEEIGAGLDKTHAAYDEAMARLKTGRGNLVKRVEDIRKLGAKATKNLPPEALGDGDADQTASDTAAPRE